MSETIKKAAVIFLTALSVAAAAFSAVPEQTAEPELYTGRGIRDVSLCYLAKLDPGDIFNAGDISALCEIPGIGEKTALRIISEREENGLYLFPEDILSVSGIGEKRLELYRSFMKINDREGRK